MNCRHCGTTLEHVFIDLVNQPPSNSFLTAQQLNEPETYFPLKLFTCHECHLVQVDEYKKSGEIFSKDYVYFSSFSTSWVEHARNYVDMIAERLDLGPDSLVVEVASNDGYLLQFMVKKDIPCFGIEPSTATARAASEKGIDSLTEFFGLKLGRRLAGDGKQVDLLLGNNVLAHVPDINDFTAGMKAVLKPSGVCTWEFPHLMQLVTLNQFDTIYHEHFSYLSLHTVQRIFTEQGLTIFDVEELPTHGGSLRVYACHTDAVGPIMTDNVATILAKEKQAGMMEMDFYTGFQARADAVKADLVSFLIQAKREGKTVAAYGAAAKGNTLLNYCGVKTDLVSFVCDASPHKQNLYMPGSHIPVLDPDTLQEKKPEYVLILPWNIRTEIIRLFSNIAEWGGKFVIPVPSLTIIDPAEK